MRVLALLLAGCASLPVAEPPELDATAEAATVLLVRGGHPKCGAVAVGAHELVTALHCLEGQQSAGYVDRAAWRLGWRTDTATIARSDPGRDLVLLATAEPLDAWAVPAFDPLTDGQPVCWSHHGGRVPYQWDCGTVTEANDHTQQDQGLFLDTTETDLAATPGDSGSGLWDQWGQLAGICAAQRESTTRALFLRGADVVALLRNEARTP